MITRFLFLTFIAANGLAQWIPENPVLSFEKLPNGILVHQQTGALRLEVCTDSIIHVTYAPQWPPAKHVELPPVKSDWASVTWDVQSDAKTITLSTATLRIAINRQDGLLTYLDAATGKSLLAEGPKQMSPAAVDGEDTFHSLDVFKVYGSDEAFYGLGQHQAGVFNMRGESVDLSQENTNIAIPSFFQPKDTVFIGTILHLVVSIIVLSITCI